MSMNTIEIDKDHYERCSLVSTEHIENSLGQQIELPDAIVDVLGEEHPDGRGERNLLQLFNLMKGCEYEKVVRDNTYNYESDLDQFFIYTIYAPVDSSDWVWSRDCFVVIEMGYPGDPRYSGYRSPQVYDLGDTQLGDSGFFDTVIGWFGQYFSSGEANWEVDSFLDSINSELSAGYGGNPTYHLGEICYAEPIWVEKLGGFVARVKGSKHPMVFTPTEPCYN